MEKPIFIPSVELQAIAGKKRKMLFEFGFKSITQARKSLPGSDGEIYQFMFFEYNKRVRQENVAAEIKYTQALTNWHAKEVAKLIMARQREMIAKEKAKQEKAKIVKIKVKGHLQTYLIHVSYVVQYLINKDGDNKAPFEKATGLGPEIKMEEILGPYTENSIMIPTTTGGPFIIKDGLVPESMPDKTKKFIGQISDHYKWVINSVSYVIEFMSKLSKKIPQNKQMMKRAFILRNDWLPYAKSISENAYVETDNKCVYYQLEKFLREPPTGRPTQFINGKRLSEEALFQFFKEGNANYNVQMGVSTEMIAKLCSSIKRNMYAYDEASKCFESVSSNDSKNYCPIVFYKLHGHFYIIDDPQAIRSVAESNKNAARKIVSSSCDEKPTEALEAFHVDEFPLENIHELASGVYILQQSGLNNDVIQYVCKYASVPRTKNSENNIIQITVLNGEKKPVHVACDANYGKNIDYRMLKNVADTNGFDYTNEGIGSVICKLLNTKNKHQRKNLSDSEKAELILSFESKCAGCGMKAESFQIDHIKPLASGGSNEMDNLQPLCKDCHKEKTIIENAEKAYRVRDESESFFNDIVHKQLVDTPQFKSYQFVEKVVGSDPLADDEISYKNDIKKCRRNIVFECAYEWPAYSVMDVPKSFSGEVQCGMYYIRTGNTYPFRGCGWYHQPLVEYGLLNGMIELDDIRFEFIPSKKLPANHFQKHIQDLHEGFGCEPDLQKKAINSFVGLMGRTKQTASYSKFTLCPDEAGAWFGDKMEDHNVFIRNHTLDNGHVLYEGIFSTDVLQEGTRYPLYSMILQIEAIELHKLETLIIEAGGTVLDRNTDANSIHCRQGS